jgi:hypothetical protein
VIAAAAAVVVVVALAGAPPSSAPRLAVVPLGVDDAGRAALERAVAARHDVRPVEAVVVDAAMTGLRNAGLSCRDDDDVACLVKLGIEGDFDLILAAGPVELHVVDVGTGKDRGRVPWDRSDAAGSVARALAPPPPTPPTPPTTTTTTPARPLTSTAVPAAATATPLNASVQQPSKLPLGLLVGVGGGLVSAGFAASAAAVDSVLSRQLLDAKANTKTLDTADFHTLETVELALIGGAVVAGAGAGVAVALLE